MFNVITTIAVFYQHASTIIDDPDSVDAEVRAEYVCLENAMGKLLWRMVVTDLLVFIFMKTVVSCGMFQCKRCIRMSQVDYEDQRLKLQVRLLLPSCPPFRSVSSARL